VPKLPFFANIEVNIRQNRNGLTSSLRRDLLTFFISTIGFHLKMIIKCQCFCAEPTLLYTCAFSISPSLIYAPHLYFSF